MKWRIRKQRRQSRKKLNVTSDSDENGSSLIMSEGGHLHISRKSKTKRGESFPKSKKQTFTQKIPNNRHENPTENDKLLERFDDGETCFFLLSSSTPSKVSTIVTTSSISSLTPTIDSFDTRDEPKGLHYSNSSLDQTSLSYSAPYHSFRTYDGNTYTSIQIPKDHSESSGVVSVASSDLSDELLLTPRINPVNYTNTSIGTYSRATQKFNRTLISAGTQKNYEAQKKTTEKGTQTDFDSCCSCSCQGTRNDVQIKPKIHLSPISLTDRRDSGISSLSATSSRTALSPMSVENSFQSINDRSSSPMMFYRKFDTNNNFDSVNTIVQTKSNPSRQPYNEEKERLITQIKKTSFDPKKELYLIELKKRLLKNRLHELDNSTADDLGSAQSFSQGQVSLGTSLWNPLSLPVKGVLKHRRIETIDEGFLPKISLPPTIKRRPLHLKTKDTIEIISQVRQCLDIVRRHSKSNGPKIMLQKQYKTHRKVKLKSYKQKKVVNTLQNDNIDDDSENPDCFPCSRIVKKEQKVDDQEPQPSFSAGQLHACAEIGDIRGILDLMQRSDIDTNELDDRGLQAIHYAFKGKHYRTAILLLESGTDIKEYTQKRINEYRNIKQMIKKNNIEIIS